MNRDEAILWTEKLASGQHNQQELSLFLEYLRNADQADIEEVLSAYHKQLGEQSSHPLLVGYGFMDQLRMLRPEAEKTSIPLNAKVKRIPAWLKFSAAAVLVISLTVSAYWFLFNASNSSLPVTVAQADTTWVMPEHNKAILTLADGSTIALDAVSDGGISDQQGVKVVKLDSALLSYKNNSKQLQAIQLPAFNTITVPVGGQYQLILADGSHVWLNSSSSLRFPVAFTTNQRKVELKGEGYFEIAKDAAKPFIVETGGMQVEVLGTHFNVMAYPDEEGIKTTLLEGSVKLNNNNHQTLIQPGEQGTLLHGGAASFKINEANVEEVTAWKEGRFRFNEMNIKPIMRQISRWYDVHVVYDGDLSGIALSGSVPRKEKVTELLRALEMSGRVKFEMKGNQILVKPFINQN